VLVTLDDIQAAARNIAGIAVRTPLVASPSWPDFWLKPESLQPVGAFKVRGAVHAVARLPPGARTAGVVTHSSGNHGQALAFAARRAGMPCVVVMPDVSPAVKVDAVRRMGAEVELVPFAQRWARTEELATSRGMTIVPPFDHADVIAGQGTVGLEIVEDWPDVDVVLVPVSGGGLISGVATAVKALRPAARVIAVEPELAAKTSESLRRGERAYWPPELTYRTIADGLRVCSPGELPWEHIRAYVDGAVTVTEGEIRAAMRLLATGGRLVAEPSGAVATAAQLFHADALPPGRRVAVVSGGNADPALLAEVLTSA
jgi:threonine dehydratase